MRNVLAIFLWVAVIGAINGQSDQSCSNSLSCVANTCCRDSDGRVIPSERGWGFEPLLGLTNGNCTPGRAQKGEVCDGVCKCDCGLECYRPLTGVCCAPHSCYDAEWVKKDREYWANCFKDPKCHFPAK